MADVKYQKPAVNSTNPRLLTTQRFNNITRASLNRILTKVRNGTADSAYGEDKDGNLTYNDANGTRIIVALEDRDRIIESMWRKHKFVGLGRLHSLLFDALYWPCHQTHC